jgi:hypothetical protein
MLENSPVREAYGMLQAHLGNIEHEKNRLVEDARTAKKEFYRKLALGIADQRKVATE